MVAARPCPETTASPQAKWRWRLPGWHLLEEAEEEHKKRNIELDIHYQGQANALLAQVAINSS